MSGPSIQCCFCEKGDSNLVHELSPSNSKYLLSWDSSEHSLAPRDLVVERWGDLKKYCPPHTHKKLPDVAWENFIDPIPRSYKTLPFYGSTWFYLHQPWAMDQMMFNVRGMGLQNPTLTALGPGTNNLFLFLKPPHKKNHLRLFVLFSDWPNWF